jgi:hypothetical protein
MLPFNVSHVDGDATRARRVLNSLLPSKFQMGESTGFHCDECILRRNAQNITRHNLDYIGLILLYRKKEAQNWFVNIGIRLQILEGLEVGGPRAMREGGLYLYTH